MPRFLESLPHMSGMIDHVIDLRKWEDPEASLAPLSFEELRHQSVELFTSEIDYGDEETLKKIIKMMAECARTGRVTKSHEELVLLEDQIRFWVLRLRANGFAIVGPHAF